MRPSLLRIAALALLVYHPIRAEEAAPTVNDAPLTSKDVNAFVDLLFAQSTPSFYPQRDGKVHKWTTPVKIHVSWPRCEAKAKYIVDMFQERTGIPLIFEGGNRWDGTTQVLFIGIKAASESTDGTSIYNWMLKYIYHDKSIINEQINILNTKDVAGSYGVYSDNNRNKLSFIQTIFNEKWDSMKDCREISRGIYLELATTSKNTSAEKSDDLDFFYLSALYDPSVIDGEDESTAIPKIKRLMIDKLTKE
jgi:hypothetical protein